MIQTIGISSCKQVRGICERSKAITIIDLVTQQNASMTEGFVGNSESLKYEAEL
jgi:methyl-accepting chemotaxis protein